VGESPWGFKSLRPHLGRNFVAAAGFSDGMKRASSISIVFALIALSGCGGGGGGSDSTASGAVAPASPRLAQKTSCEGGPIVAYDCGPQEMHLLRSRH
jgi:hypothetical protein